MRFTDVETTDFGEKAACTHKGNRVYACVIYLSRLQIRGDSARAPIRPKSKGGECKARPPEPVLPPGETCGCPGKPY